MRETRVQSLGREDPLEKEMENSMDGEAWWATVHGVAKSQTRLSDFTSLHAYLQYIKGARQGCILSPCLFNLYSEYIMRNVGLDEA